MLYDNSVDRGEAHAATFTAFFGGEKWLEDAIEDVRLHANASIRNRKNRLMARNGGGIHSAVKVVNLYHLRFDQQAATIRHSVAGVKAEVHLNLLELRRIGFEGVQ